MTYRQYEDPHMIERWIEEVKNQMENEHDEDRLIDLHGELESLKERLNFAWQDDEETYG